MSLPSSNQLALKHLILSDDEATLFFEFKGNTKGQNYHWYAKAVKHLQHVYLVTATDSQQNWDSHKQQLMSVVNSFELK